MGQAATRILKLLGRGLLSLAACFLALVLGGCGGVEFQGKLFDYAGLSNVGKPQEDVRMTERAPLLVPPDPHRIFPPGSPQVTRADWPVDSDKERKKIAEAKQEQERKKAAEAEPNNPYAGKPNLLDKVLGRDKKPEAEPVDVPEPDPSDKTAEDKAREQASSTPIKPVDQSMNAPATPADQDPFHPQAPDSYKGMSNPSGNDANY